MEITTKLVLSCLLIALFCKGTKSFDHQRPQCTLGNYTYQLGERWSPNLPPFGVQVCVQCECIVRQRKNCFETKVTCRRIANECPIIDACLDGKKPVTIAGQCCKSCQSDNGSSLQIQAQSTTIDGGGGVGGAYPVGVNLEQSPLRQEAATILPEKVLYNERIKEYQTIIKTSSPCQKRDRTNNDKHANSGANSNFGLAKAPKGNKNDLNGIDSRLAFKSLHDSQSIYLQTNHQKSRQNNFGTVYDSLKHDHQHPNDVQAATAAAAGNQPNGTYQARPSSQPRVLGPNTCILGNQTFQVGDKWNPYLPSFGVQVCVLCECVMRQRKSCNEAKVTCRRIVNECPIIDSCPDGKKPVTTEGQCCKSCRRR